MKSNTSKSLPPADSICLSDDDEEVEVSHSQDSEALISTQGAEQLFDLSVIKVDSSNLQVVNQNIYELAKMLRKVQVLLLGVSQFD